MERTMVGRDDRVIESSSSPSEHLIDFEHLLRDARNLRCSHGAQIGCYIKVGASMQLWYQTVPCVEGLQFLHVISTK
eukprot:2890076-Amphidinium_carterae.1